MRQTKRSQTDVYKLLKEKFPHEQDIAGFSHYLATQLLEEKRLFNESLGSYGEGAEFENTLRQHIKIESLISPPGKRAWCMAAGQFLLLEEAVDLFFTFRDAQAALLERLKLRIPDEKDLEGFSHYLAARLAEDAFRYRIKPYTEVGKAEWRAKQFLTHVFRSVAERRDWCVETNIFIEVEARIEDFFKLREKLLGSSQKDLYFLTQEARGYASTINQYGYYKFESDEKISIILEQHLSEQYRYFLEEERYQYRQYLASLMHQPGYDELREAMLDCFRANWNVYIPEGVSQ